MKKIYHLLIVALLVPLFSACDEFDTAPYLGTWGLVAYGENGHEWEASYGSDYEEYVFYDDWTGFFSNGMGVRTQFYYDERGSRHLYLRHSDGITEDIYYRFDRGYMIMSNNSSFYSYRVYDRVRY
ncbi:MAG: hypothetical protein IK092_05815 [Muribaculaceae bacterium]|nr:hypothetical protein [Muribaculaceae bacterium]